MQAYRVFISSIMNAGIEDLAAERFAARSAVERFAPVTVAWAFEGEPASPKPLLDFYLDAAKTCDSFILIVGQRITIPVKDEVRIAQDYRKPLLVFCKGNSDRDAETEILLRALNVKYDTFVNAVELQEKIRISLGSHLLSLIRGETTREAGVGDRLAQLREYARTRRMVQIFPTIPTCHYNSFAVEEITGGTIRFQKNGMANVYVPVERIAGILEVGSHEKPTIQLNGRLQWITARQNWYFRIEPPPLPDPLMIGLGRQVATANPALSPETVSLLNGRGFQFGWSNPENVPTREVFFDEDGRHLTNGRLILTVTQSV